MAGTTAAGAATVAASAAIAVWHTPLRPHQLQLTPRAAVRAAATAASSAAAGPQGKDTGVFQKLPMVQVGGDHNAFASPGSAEARLPECLFANCQSGCGNCILIGDILGVYGS